MPDAVEKFGGIVGSLLPKEGIKNSVVNFILQYLSNVLVMASGQAETEIGQKMLRSAAVTVLQWEWKLRASVQVSPTSFDDTILDELVEACKEIVPGFVPVD